MVDIGPLLKGMLALLAVSVPLGLWKLVDIVIWVFDHVSVDLG